MSTAGYIFVASLFIAAATAIRLLRRYDVNWIAQDLQRIDLRVLGEIADGKRFGVGRDRRHRLSKRGFAIDERFGGCRITLKGRYAAFIIRAQRKFDADPHV